MSGRRLLWLSRRSGHANAGKPILSELYFDASRLKALGSEQGGRLPPGCGQALIAVSPTNRRTDEPTNRSDIDAACPIWLTCEHFIVRRKKCELWSKVVFGVR